MSIPEYLDPSVNMEAPPPAKTLSFVDAAFASAISGGPYDGVAFYIGGDARHVWTTAELASRPERYRLPIWVRSNPTAVTAVADAMACLEATARYAVPHGALVALDSETSIDPAFVKQFVAVVNSGGHRVIDYGSENDVFQNQNPDGYVWAADWTGVKHFANGSKMTQYVSFKNDDLSVAEASLPFWDTKPAPAPKPKPTTEPWDYYVSYVKPGETGHNAIETQHNWRLCHKCHGLFWVGLQGDGVCAASGAHSAWPS